ncbi:MULTISPECIES: 4Fe-4S binding protein [Pseudothermotoga]|jgi:dihydroorotate dehydrogenase (fumarate)|uniref:dihydrouracil dehydrogenase (NAD(+)) n=1 Tax=Pseudothermotoga lettingae (strain ATCC BAA-301 / DSM 14385 / NBRC 107922 / TMO) TaxID=416591 RepID=A8F8E8_PSELT|nr:MULTISPECIES: 4Fe-4S binding protein [Pseudothermotoga]ABV34432.1 dihydroorotate dehydrogenase [Pseudothermotoga lettingae TMO]KUK21716.1 MAG: Dihydroorotate dehydrogenase [Pseudothermotoga lettingae]GLI48623.1 dihydroorotate dehydrogenase [Pseudothermotoga lettingae TMO]HBJ80968.1 dihydroorotate dehydrogenase [Pseudothermotoga sp.]HBT25989.1 dihydroorotate dehydrogenase [Pseudothermotoga sp.]
MDLSCEYVGIKLKNPIIVASSGLAENLKNMKKAEEHGAACVVAKSLFEEKICRISPTPRFEIIERKMGKLRSQTFYSFEQASPFDAHEYFEEIRKAVNTLSIPVIPSINCVTDEGWSQYARMAEGAGAPALELNVSCPHGSISFRGGDVEEKILSVAKIVRDSVKIPLIVKLPMQLSSPLSMAKMLERSGIDGVVMFNRLTGLDINLEKERPVLHEGYAGHGGPWAFNYVLRWIAASSPHLNISVAASGGVGSGEDIIKYIYAGANAVEVCSLIYLSGYEAIDMLLEQIKAFMERKSYPDFSQIKGKLSGKAILSNEQIDRRHLFKAQINQALCTSCGTCQKVCIYDAPYQSEKSYVISELCDGCGLCVKLCPVKAIEMVKWSEKA